MVMLYLLFASLCVTSYLGTSKGELSPAFSDLDIGTQNICGESVPPQYPSQLDFPTHDVIIPSTFRRDARRLERKVLQLKQSVSYLLHLYESNRLLRLVNIDRIQHVPPCFQLINRTSYEMTDLSPLSIYHSLQRDLETMTDFLGMLELMKEDEETFEDSELILHFRQVAINTKSLLCELSFSVSGLESSVPATVVEIRLEKWCVAEGADDGCSRCNRDSMILSMIDKLSSTLRQKYRHIRRSIG